MPGSRRSIPSLVHHGLVVEPAKQRIAVAAAVDLEIPQVRRGPAHGHLDCFVQGLQRRPQRHVDPPPDRRFEFLKLDAHPRDSFAHYPVPSACARPFEELDRRTAASTGASSDGTYLRRYLYALVTSESRSDAARTRTTRQNCLILRPIGRIRRAVCHRGVIGLIQTPSFDRPSMSSSSKFVPPGEYPFGHPVMPSSGQPGSQALFNGPRLGSAFLPPRPGRRRTAG